ncbi:MAG: cell division protein ZapA [Eubacterium sp.]|nr:cell division protein ZapA [Eubacterium sp.]
MGLNMKNKNDVEVLINGRKYTICGFESAEYLQKVATYINSKYMEFKDKEYYYSLDLDLRNILLAVNIADDYFKAKKEAWLIQKDNERKDKMVLEMKHEILDSQSGTAKVGQENEALKDDLEEAEKKIVELNVKNEDNVTKVAALEEKLSKVEAENSGNAARLEDAEKEYTELKAKLEEAEKENGELKAKIEAAERRITDLENKNRKGKR